VLEQLVWHDRPAGSERFHGSFEVARVPEHDRGDDEVQPAGAEPLVVEGAILDHAAASRVAISAAPTLAYRRTLSLITRPLC